MFHVYAKCFAGGSRGIYLQVEASFKTRWECQKLIKSRVSQGRPTHFLFIPNLDIDKATKRYAD